MRVGGGRWTPVHVLVMAKAPVAGKVKTRLSPPCSPAEAAAVAEAALADTLSAVAACQAEHKLVALDGEPGAWLPSGLQLIAQRGGGLDERLANAWTDTRSRSAGWGIQIGMDTPQVTAAELDDLLAILTDGQPTDGQPDAGQPDAGAALLGPAADGGWWAIGLPGTDPHLVFPGVPMSTPTTGRAQARRLRRLGLDVHMVNEHRDIDTVNDLRVVAATIPASRTAAVARRILPGEPGTTRVRCRLSAPMTEEWHLATMSEAPTSPGGPVRVRS